MRFHRLLIFVVSLIFWARPEAGHAGEDVQSCLREIISNYNNRLVAGTASTGFDQISGTIQKQVLIQQYDNLWQRFSEVPKSDKSKEKELVIENIRSLAERFPLKSFEALSRTLFRSSVSDQDKLDFLEAATVEAPQKFDVSSFDSFTRALEHSLNWLHLQEPSAHTVQVEERLLTQVEALLKSPEASTEDEMGFAFYVGKARLLGVYNKFDRNDQIEINFLMLGHYSPEVRQVAQNYFEAFQAEALSELLKVSFDQGVESWQPKLVASWKAHDEDMVFRNKIHRSLSHLDLTGLSSVLSLVAGRHWKNKKSRVPEIELMNYMITRAEDFSFGKLRQILEATVDLHPDPAVRAHASELLAEHQGRLF